MTAFLSFIVHTINVLGIFNDPFEFEGDYGPEANATRQKVFEQVISKETRAEQLSEAELQKLYETAVHSPSITLKEYRKILVNQGKEWDASHGPTLSELIPSEIIEMIGKKQIEWQSEELGEILELIKRHQNQKLFSFMRKAPPDLLRLDKTLRDKAAREGRSFDLPILSSMQPLDVQNSLELKRQLFDAIFQKEHLALTQKKQQHLPATEPFSSEELDLFASPAGQLVFYWVYQALNLDLLSSEPGLIQQVNNVKLLFAQTLGNSNARAALLKDKLIAAGSSVIFSQESDALFAELLVKDGFFLPTEGQNAQDGTLIFMRSDEWEPHPIRIPLEGYEGDQRGRVNLLLATKKTGERFLLASCHGHSTQAEDGRLQISLIMEKFRKLSQGDLQLIIGIDANTKSEEDVRLFREHLDQLGLVATSVGPTTLKKRWVTTQHTKVGRLAIDEEDYLITLKPEKGGRYNLTHPTVGFREKRADGSQFLPNRENPSDHFSVGAELSPNSED